MMYSEGRKIWKEKVLGECDTIILPPKTSPPIQSYQQILGFDIGIQQSV